MKTQLFILFLLLITSLYSFAQSTFQKTFGGAYHEDGNCVHQTTDGGYIVVGSTPATDGIGRDAYLIKTYDNGNLAWSKTYSGGEGNFVQQTSDGGYIIVGSAKSPDGPDLDVYLIKTYANGNLAWSRTYGGALHDYGNSIQQTTDGGFIIAGTTSGFGASVSDIYLIKTYSDGNLQWAKTYGGPLGDDGYAVQQTTDGGYIIVGSSHLPEPQPPGVGAYAACLIKTTDSGDTVWTKEIVGNILFNSRSVHQTMDEGFIIVGLTDVSNQVNTKIGLIKTNNIGEIAWIKAYDGGILDDCKSVQQTTDGGYIIVGTKGVNEANPDVYLIKTNSEGVPSWSKTIGGAQFDFGNSVQQTTDGGYIIAGTTLSFGVSGTDVYLIKTDSVGNSGCNQEDLTPVVYTPANQFISLPLIVSSPPTNEATVNSLVGNSGTENTICTSFREPKLWSGGCFCNDYRMTCSIWTPWRICWWQCISGWQCIVIQISILALYLGIIIGSVGEIRARLLKGHPGPLTALWKFLTKGFNR